MIAPGLAPPFDLTFPDIDRGAALAVLFGVLLAALAADVLLTLTPFARERTSRPVATLMLAAFAAACVVFGAFADHSQGSLVVAAIIGVPTALAYGWASRSGRDGPNAAAVGVLPDGEWRRRKTQADRWVLVLGSAASGKTMFVEALIRECRPHMTTRVRSAQYDGLRVSEVSLSDRRFRFWEARSIGRDRGRLRPLTDFDAVVLVVDPTQHTPIAGSFPATLRDGREATDANDDVLRLSEALHGSCTVWAVVTKADLLRLSVHSPLIDAVPVGPAWYPALRDMDVTRRRPLAEALQLGQLLREHQPAFDWGTRSPLFAFAGNARRDPFGARELLSALFDTL